MVKTLSQIFSITDLLRTPEPKTFLEDELIKLLARRLKQLDILWNPRSFRAGLANPKLPSHLLKKLESLLEVAEAVGWDISNELRHELDETVEDIETFNPAFRKRLAREHRSALKDIKLGRLISGEDLARKLGLSHP